MMFNNRNVRISPDALIGKNVRIGDNTLIFDNVIIGDNSTIAHNCVIGEPFNEYYSNPEYKNPVTVIGANSLIRSHTIIYAGNKLGKYFATGHHVMIRENNLIGDYTLIGSLSEIQGNIKIGNHCRLYSNVIISQLSSIGNFVFIYPLVVLTNDPYPPSYDLKGAIVSDYTVLGTHSVILSGVRIGKNCLVGANSLVNINIPDFSFARGYPVKLITDIRKYVVLGKGRPYPWMYRYSKGMPWKNQDYDEWATQV